MNIDDCDWRQFILEINLSRALNPTGHVSNKPGRFDTYVILSKSLSNILMVRQTWAEYLSANYLRRGVNEFKFQMLLI